MQSTYALAVQELSDRLVDAQRPIRVLDAVEWDEPIEQAFHASGGRELPRVDRSYYESRRPLRFDPAEKHGELKSIERDAAARLGAADPVARILARMVGEYRGVVDMLAARGTPEFPTRARALYGSARDRFSPSGPTMAELASRLSKALDRIDESGALPAREATYSGDQAVEILQRRLDAAFHGSGSRVRVSVSDGIVADAAAGADRIKLRREATFTERELRLLEVHEGWVHVGTTLNGLEQPHCRFLAKGVPSATVTQEGLAVFVEVIALTSYPARIRRLDDRVHALELAEDGAGFLDVYRFFRDRGAGERAAYAQTVRVFRGSTPEGRPFTKDVSYMKGFVLVYAHLERLAHQGLVERFPVLFCGKTSLEDMDQIHALVDQGLIQPPVHLPPQFADPHALTSWLCYSNYLASTGIRDVCDALISSESA